MKTKKNTIEPKLMCNLITRVFAPLVCVSWLLTSNTSHGLVPDFAEITKIQDEGSEGEGVTINSQPAKIGDKLTQYEEELTIAPKLGSKSNFANLDLVKEGVKPLWIKATAKDGQRTVYQIPCQLKEDRYAEAEITWSNGKKSVCGEGVRVTPNTRKISYFPNSQDIQMAQAKNLDIAKAKNIAIQVTQNSPKWNYYCSSVADNYRGPLGYFAVENTSMEEACTQSQQKCKKSRHKYCSIATMGKWNLNDSDLRASFMCYDGRSENSELFTGQSLNEHLQKLKGSISIFPKILDNEDLITKALKIAAYANGSSCYLEVHQTEEVLISPVNNQLTRVQTSGADGGIKVDVLEGGVKLHSTKNPEGILASIGKSYFFNGAGLVRSTREGREDPPSSPIPATPTPPVQPPSSPPPSSPSIIR